MAVVNRAPLPAWRLGVCDVRTMMPVIECAAPGVSIGEPDPGGKAGDGDDGVELMGAPIPRLGGAWRLFPRQGGCASWTVGVRLEACLSPCFLTKRLARKVG